MKLPTTNYRLSTRSCGYTLIELVVAVGLFALIMTLASGAYFIVINLNRQVQGVTTGINNLSFALETMTRSIRTGTDYNCGGIGDCQNGSSNFAFRDTNNVLVSYRLSGSSIRETRNGVESAITDPSVNVTSLMFYAIGTRGMASNDFQQPHVTIAISGTILYGAGKTESFSVQTGATMRGPDI
jgi:prepilin-type N-terminal cleavage/methylation domain-containing protein